MSDDELGIWTFVDEGITSSHEDEATRLLEEEATRMLKKLRVTQRLSETLAMEREDRSARKMREHEEKKRQDKVALKNKLRDLQGTRKKK